MKQATVLVLLCLCGIPSYSQTASVYHAKAVIVLSTGTDEGQVGYRKSYGEGGGFAGPTDYAFSPESNLYVSDHINSRIDVFDRDFRFVRSIHVKDFGDYPVINRLEVNSAGEMLAVVDLEGLYLLDKDGEVLFTMKQGGLSAAVIKRYDAFFYGEGILYSDDSLNYHILGKDGSELTQVSKAARWDSMVDEIGKLYKSDKEAVASMVDTLRTSGIVWDGGRLLTTDFARQRKLWGQLRNLAISSRTMGKDVKILDTVSDATFLGFNTSANSYWLCFEKARFNYRFILIMSPLGDVRDYFTSDILSRARPVIAPNGDVYFMIAGEDGVSVSKIERVW